MELRVLGSVEAWAGDEPVAIGAGKPRALLAMLALNAGSPVPAERLIDGLWGEEPPPTAPKMVQAYVSQLRKVLAASGDGAEILTRGRGYELRLNGGDVDARRFERLVADGAPRDALALWRGPPLDDVATEPFAALEIRRLEEMRLAAAELAIEQDLAAGRHAELVAELEALVAEEPLRERLHAQRMLALYRCGRQADALQAYRRAREALVDAIGVEPGPELRRIHEAILRQDPSLDLPAPELPPELDTSTPLVGRDAELARLQDEWRRAKRGAGGVVLIAGAPGMGKTRLAAELAAEVHAEGAAVVYASGSGEAALERARASGHPALLVLDDSDAAPEVEGVPVLALVTTDDPRDAAITLAPLPPDAAQAIARSYGPGAPVDESGVPQRIHRAARAWARAETARRLGESADRAAAERARQRAAEDDLAGDVVELQAAWERGEEPAGDAVVTCPFKGLASFDADDAEFFFGRERLVAEMVARLPGASLLGIVGPSGSGKSSALRAGLLPALANGVLPGSDRWAIAFLRPGEHPLEALRTAVREAPLKSKLVIAVDQFEEVFTECRDEAERAAFADALVAAVRDPRRRAMALVALRADFYGRCASYPELWRMLGANHVPVGPMRRDELRRAIESPAQRAGLRVDPELVDALIADVEGEPGALPLLSTSLLESWQQRDGRRLTMAAYEHAGGVRGAVARLAERAYGRLTPEQRPVARAILLRMAGAGEGDAAVRRRVSLIELEGAQEVLSALADDRLVTVREGEAEVAHEALLREWPRLRGWLEEDVEGRRLHRHLGVAAREWDARGRDPGELYRGARLAAALDWSAGHADELDATERAFIHESRAASERSQRRLRAVLIGVGALLLVAVIAGVVALEQRGTARKQATAADAQRLGSRALAENDLDRSLLLARQGIALDDSPQTRGNLLAALIKSPAAVGVLRGGGERVTAIALSPDERTLAAGDPAGNVFLFDTRTRRRVTAPDVQPGDWAIAQLAYSPDGRRLAIAHDSNDGHLVTLMDTRTRRMGLRLETNEYGRRITAVRFAGATVMDIASSQMDPTTDPRSIVERFELKSGTRRLGPITLGRQTSPLLGTRDGRRIVTASDEQLVVRDPETLKPVDRVDIGLSSGNRKEGAIALSPDDRTAAVGGGDGSLRFVDLRSGAVRRASGRHGGAVTGARFTPDGSSLVTTSDDGDAIVWDVGARAAAETLSGHANGIAALEITGDGRTLYTAGLDGSVFVWDLVGTRRLGRPIEAGGPTRTEATLSSDGRRLAIGHDDGTVSVANLGERGRRRRFAVIPEGGEVTGVRFVPGSRLLIVTGEHLLTALVDTDTGRIVRTLGQPRVDPLTIDATPGVSGDGRLAVTLDETGGGDVLDVLFWTLPAGRPVGKPLRVDRETLDAQLSPDGRLLTAVVVANAGIEGGAVEAWDVRSRRRVRSLRFGRLPSFVRFSPDGSLFAIGNRYGESRVYATETFKPVTRVLTGDAGGILSAAVTPDNRTLATGTDTGAVQLWDIPSGQALGAPLPGVPSSGVVPAFSPDGGRVVATYATGRAYVWDIRSRSLIDHACRVAGRRLTRAEWEEFLPGREYDPAC